MIVEDLGDEGFRGVFIGLLIVLPFWILMAVLVTRCGR